MKITIQLVLLVVLLGSMALTGCCTLAKSDRAKTIAALI
jgi:outer membrane murein-binding lipoprotein Lpp